MNPVTESKRLKSKEEQEYWDKASLAALGIASKTSGEFPVTLVAAAYADELVDLRRIREYKPSSETPACSRTKAFV